MQNMHLQNMTMFTKSEYFKLANNIYPNNIYIYITKYTLFKKLCTACIYKYCHVQNISIFIMIKTFDKTRF